jgi:hypothetical protein
VLGPPPPIDGSLDAGTPIPSLFGTLSAVDLADQVELIKISPVYLSTEELSKMWTAMQARYRPTMAYMVSVVIIQANGGGRAAQPVLKRGPDDRGPVAVATAPPSLAAVRPAASDLLPGIRLGDDLFVSGTGLDLQGDFEVVFENSRAQLVRGIAPSGPRSKSSLSVTLPSVAADPDAMHQWAIGLYAVSVRVTRPDAPVFSTNGVPVALAPTIAVAPSSAAPGDTVTLTCSPRLLEEQRTRATVIFGSRSVAPSTITSPADATQPTSITFVVPPVVAGDYLVRLRVDGIDSIPITIAGVPPQMDFDPQQKVTVI